MGASHEDVGLSPSGGTGAAHRVIGEASGANQRRIADAPGHLEKEPTGGGATAEVSLGIDRREVNRSVSARIAKEVRTVFANEVPDLRIELVRFGLQPFVEWRQVLLPIEPDLSGLVGEKILMGKAVDIGKAPSTRAHQQHVVGGFHDQLGDLGGILHTLQGCHRPGASGRSMHHAGIELNHSLFVGDPAVPYGHVVGVILHQIDAGDRGIEGIGAGAHSLDRALYRPQAVGAGNGDG